MKVLFKIFLLVLLAILPIVPKIAWAQEKVELKVAGPELAPAHRTADETRIFNEMNSFLMETGFPDLSASIAKTLSAAHNPPLEQLNRETLEANWHRLQIVNFARELAAEFLTKMIPMMSDSQASAKAAELGARLLSQKRLAIPDAFPDAIRNIKNHEQRVAAKQQFLHGAIEKNIIRMQEQILSDFLHTIYGRGEVEKILNGANESAKQELTAYIKRLDTLIYRYTRSLYFDHEMGMGHWLGEALALGLVHTSRLSNDPKIRQFEALLNQRASAHGEYLSDAISDTLTFEDADGNETKIKVKHADTITEIYALAQGSRMSAAGPRPHILNRWKAFRDNLLQWFVYAAVTADETPSMWEAIDGKEPSLINKMRQYFAASQAGKVGASHAGMAYVYKNPKSGVAITRAIDMYAFGPMPYGGARFITTKSIFASPGVFANFGLASLNPQKTLTYLQKLTKEKGYQPVFKVSDVYRPDENKKLVKSEGETFSWSPRITEAEQKKILDVKMEDAEKWYNEDLAPRLASEMLRYITDYGMAFRTYGVEPSNKWACYCSEGVNIAGFRETGLNLQSRSDRLLLLGRAARFVHPKLRKLIPSETPIAPNFMAWDPKTDVETVHYRIRGPLESWTEQMQAPRTDYDSQLTTLISGFVNRTMEYNEVQIGQARYSPESFVNRAEVSVVPDPERSHLGIYEPRVHPMGKSTNEQEKLNYNPVPPSDAKAAIVSEQESHTRRLLHESVMRASQNSQGSKAAGFILAELGQRLNGAETRKLMEIFAAKMMALKPINPPRMIPHEFKVLSPQQRDSAISNWILNFTAEQIESHTRQIVSDIAGILYGQDVVQKVAADPEKNKELSRKLSELYKLVGLEVREIYLNPEKADARILGANLAVALIYSGIRSDRDSVSAMAENLKTYGLKLEDFFAANLKSKAVQTEIKLGQLASLKLLDKPGKIQRDRLSQPVKGIAPRYSELAQLRYSPYAEVQPELTRSLDTLFNKDPQFNKPDFSKLQSQALVQRSVYTYMIPLNNEQMGSAGDIFSSHMIRANSCRAVIEQ